MDLETAKGRHSVLKRKANESLANLMDITQASAAKRKSQIQKLRDNELYKKIIRTYKSPIWSGCAVSPRDLADFGWTCIKKNTTKCVECEQILSTVLPSISSVSINVYNTCLKNVHEKMVSAHRPTCRQRAGAPPFRISEPTSKEILDEIEQRLSAASSFSEEDIVVDNQLSEVTVPKIEKFSENFVYVAAIGWKIAKFKRGYISFNCDHCARELIIKTGGNFDPVRNHERWCPRVDKNDSGEPIWQTDLNIVLNTKNKTTSSSSSSSSAATPQHFASIIKEVYSTRRLLNNSVSSVLPPSLI